MQQDSELLRRYAANRSDEAFTQLVQRHLKLVYCSALLRTNGDAHLAEDITQLVFIALAREAASLRAHTVLAGWLYVATRNAAAQAMRARQRRLVREQEAFAMQQSSSSPTAEADWNRFRPHLEAVLDELDKRDREAVLLRFFENRPFAEIGDSLRISADAARMRVDRALEKLRGFLARRGITSTTVALAVALESQAAAPAPAGLAVTIHNAVRASGAIGCTPTVNSARTFDIMNTTTMTIGLASVVSLLALGTAIYQTNQARRSEAALVATSEVSAKRIQDIQAKLIPEDKTRVTEQSLRENKASVAADTTQPAKRQKKGGPPAASAPASFGESMKDPAYAAAWRQETLTTLQKRYEKGFAALNLPSDKLAQFEELMLARVEATLDAREVGQSAGLTKLELWNAQIEAKNVWNERIKELVGDADFISLEKSVYGSVFKNLVESSFAVDLAKAGIPLTPDQLTAVAFSLGDMEGAYSGNDATRDMPPKTRFVVDPHTELSPFDQALLGRFSQDLTPAQLQVVKDYYINKNERQRLSKTQ